MRLSVRAMVRKQGPLQKNISSDGEGCLSIMLGVKVVPKS